MALRGPRRLLLLAGEHRAVDGDVLQAVALLARVGDLGLGHHLAPLGPEFTRLLT